MRKKQKENWRDLVRGDGEMSWSERRRFFGLCLLGPMGMIGAAALLVRSLFRSPLVIDTFVPMLFSAGLVATVVAASTWLIYRRPLTDQGLFRAGVVRQAGSMLLGLTFLLEFVSLSKPWKEAEKGTLLFWEYFFVILVLAAFIVFHGVSLFRLIHAYRRGDQPPEKQEIGKPGKKKASKFGFWGLGAILLVALALSLMVEYQYRKIRVEYEDLEAQRIQAYTDTNAGEAFDRERYDRVSSNYRTLKRWAHEGRYSAEKCLLFFGMGLLLWVLILIGRVISRAAWRSVERDEAREEKREMRERSKDPWK